MRPVMSAALVLSLLVLAGCQREKDFDERYSDAQARMTAMARDIDARVAATGVPEGGAQEDDTTASD